jgi:hypothetical protein
MIPTAVWISILVNLVGVAVGYGILQGKVAALREIVAELKAGRERTGDRLAKLEQFAEVVKYASRLNTSVHGISLGDSEGSKT